jgi:hypothetical protein
MPALPATSASQLDRSAITGAASSAARVRLAEITWESVSSSVRARSVSRTRCSSSTMPSSRARSRISSSAPLPSRRRLTSATPSESNSVKASRTRSAGSSIRANASATSPSRSSLLRRLPLWSRSAMPICARASSASPVPCAASAVRRVKRCSAMSSVCCSTPDAFGGEAQLLQRLDADADRVGGLADGIRRRNGSINESGEATDRGDACEGASEETDASAQQLRLAAEALEPARGALARALDALQALLAALADRDQLGLDLATPFDRQPDRVGLRASGHGSVCLSCSGDQKS